MDWNDDNLLPRKGDLLVRNDDHLANPRSNACLNPTWGDADHGYTEGYRRGARLLVQHIVETQRDQDYLAYPIIFLYRHHIELALKNIIRRASRLIERPLKKWEEKHLCEHHLDSLWKDLKQIFNTIKETGWGKPDAAVIEGIDDYIDQLCELDPDSFHLRYPRSKKDVPYLHPNLIINLQHFAEMLESLADCLDALDTATYVLEENLAEMDMELRTRYLDYA